MSRETLASGGLDVDESAVSVIYHEVRSALVKTPEPEVRHRVSVLPLVLLSGRCRNVT